MSKDVKPKRRIGHQPGSRRKRIAVWTLGLLALGAGGYAAWRYSARTVVEVPVARVRRGEFVLAVRTRGDIKSTRSIILTAPQVPSPSIVRLAESGKPVKKGDVVVEFDTAAQEQYYLERATSVSTADSRIVQTKASHKITNEMDAMGLMQAEYNVERSKLEASKAEILSEIEGAKNRINVGISEGELNQLKTSIQSHEISQDADLESLQESKDKSVRDMERAKGYLTKMVIRAPLDGIIHILPNFRSGGSFGRTPPPFKEGDNAWTGAAIAEIPDLSEMRVEVQLDEVDRGKAKLGQQVKIRVDVVPDREFLAELEWISPIATLLWRGMGRTGKVFPAYATLKNLDPRLRPGMSSSVEIVIESQPDVLLIPVRASFIHDGRPSVRPSAPRHYSSQWSVDTSDEKNHTSTLGLHRRSGGGLGWVSSRPAVAAAAAADTHHHSF
jgi:multidrug efflux pump subunit AcrA (membrane-fusion protein)